MTNQHSVISRRVQLPVNGVVQRRMDENLTAFEGEDFVDEEVSFENGFGYWYRIFLGHFAAVPVAAAMA